MQKQHAEKWKIALEAHQKEIEAAHREAELLRQQAADDIAKVDDDVTILSFQGKQVRIGITAPVDVSVHREEITGKLNLMNRLLMKRRNAICYLCAEHGQGL